MIKQFLLYQIPTPAPSVFDQFLGGLYLIKGVPLFIQLAVLILYPLALGLLLTVRDTEDSKKQAQTLRLSKLCSLTAFSLTSLLLFTPWDESFINLRHSLNLTQNNVFSFNLSTPSEGTVDFLVFAILGLVGKLKLPLLELLLFQSWLGGLLCILAIQSIAKALDIPGAKKWSIFIATLFPPLMLNSSHGFATSIFAAAILWALYFTFINRKFIQAFLVLSLIPIIRWEGFWFLALSYACLFRDINLLKNRFRSLVPLSILALLPTLALMLYRRDHFQSWIPVPVIYKSSLGNIFYFILGMRNFFLDLISTFGIAFLIPWIMTLAGEKGSFSKLKTLSSPLIILVLFSIPYYLSGGDWFPPAWGRYLLPAILFLLVSTWKLLSVLRIEQLRLFIISFIFSLIICAAAPTSSFIRLYQLTFSHGSALLSLNLKKRIDNPIYRPHYLSQLGFHLKKTTEITDRIGSSELATLMYFSERDAVDFLGLTDLELARLPLRQSPSFIRQNPKAAELPLLIFKRLAPERLMSSQPEYLYLFDFMIEILMDQKNTEDWSDNDYFKALHRWESKFKGLVDPLYGGVKNILSLGYLPIIVSYDNDFCALYFVHRNKLNEHKQKLTHLGFTGRTIEGDFTK